MIRETGALSSQLLISKARFFRSRLEEKMEGSSYDDDEVMEHAIMIYAHYLGIDLDEEKDLIIIAKKALETLPKEWQLGFGEPDSQHSGVPYFYNTTTDESSWTHPKEQIYFELVQKERARLQESDDKKQNKGKKKAKKKLNEDRSDDASKISKTTPQMEDSMVVEEFDDWEESERANNKVIEPNSKRKSEETTSFGLSEADFDHVDEVVELAEPEPG